MLYRFIHIGLFALCVSLLLSANSAYAQITELPGNAAAERVIDDRPAPDLPSNTPDFQVPNVMPDVVVPQGAEKITFVLRSVTIEGAEVFSEKELAFTYDEYLGKEITLDKVWQIAANVTAHYRENRYFLSRAYVPAQEIETGEIIIRVANGYIGDVIKSGPGASLAILDDYVQQLKQTRALKADVLESILLRLNDLPGLSFTALIEPIENGEEGAIRLVLNSEETDGRGTVSFDNFGSRFLGPYQSTVSYVDSFFDRQETTFSFSTSLPADELNYFAIRHAVQIAPDWRFTVSGNYVEAEPGATLQVNEIQSDSIELAFELSHQLIRQRQENLSVSIGLDGKNTSSDILGNTALTRDRIRALRLRLDYDTADRYRGYNYLSIGLDRGLEVLSSSEQGDANLSRAEAEPDFTKLTLNYTRQYAASRNILFIGQVAAQLASGPLFSAEEFGVGGQQFGRAYDPSEITGDHGFAASAEFRYLGLDPAWNTSFVPYTFFDAGQVFNDGAGDNDESVISAGLGVRAAHESGVAANLGAAWPLTQDIGLPINGRNSGPRVIMQLTMGF